MLSPNCELHKLKQNTLTASEHRKRRTGIAAKRHFIVNRFPIEQMWNYTGGIRIPLPQQTKLNLSNCFQIAIVNAIPSFKHL